MWSGNKEDMKNSWDTVRKLVLMTCSILFVYNQKTRLKLCVSLCQWESRKKDGAAQFTPQGGVILIIFQGSKLKVREDPNQIKQIKTPNQKVTQLIFFSEEMKMSHLALPREIFQGKTMLQLFQVFLQNINLVLTACQNSAGKQCFCSK